MEDLEQRFQELGREIAVRKVENKEMKVQNAKLELTNAKMEHQFKTHAGKIAELEKQSRKRRRTADE